MIAGVDGCDGGWLAVMEMSDGGHFVAIYDSFEKLIANQDLKTVLIDIPIGLSSKGPRLCDIEARRFIGPRNSSVFPAPLRPMLKARSWAEACEVRFQIEGKRCSKQAWAITDKIRTVDECMTPELQNRIFEGHPEVSFACINAGQLRSGKHSDEGRQYRVQLLERHYPRVRERLRAHAGLRSELDIIDGFACLWTARRLLNGNATRLPFESQLDEHSLRMEINA